MTGVEAPGSGRRRIELQGHRGARGHAPENTLAGFGKAMDIGVDTLELDLGMSRDGELMVHHDLGLNPDTTRDHSGRWVDQDTPLFQLDADDIMEFDVGRIRPDSEYEGRFPFQQPVDGERIPSLDTVFDWAHCCGHDHIRFNLEVKSDAAHPGRCAGPHHFAHAVASMVERWQMHERVVVQSFDWRVQYELQRLGPPLATSYLSSQRPHWDTIGATSPGPSPWTAHFDVHEHGQSVARAIVAAGGHVWAADHRDLSHERIREAHDLDLRVFTWTVNEVEDIQRVLEMGVDAIITDYPDRVHAALSGTQRTTREGNGS